MAPLPFHYLFLKMILIPSFIPFYPYHFLELDRFNYITTTNTTNTYIPLPERPTNRKSLNLAT